MNISRQSPGELRLDDIPDFLVGLLKHLPEVAGSSDEGAEARIYPSPSDDPGLEELVSDWNAHVQPGLQEAFQGARDVVASDLRQLAAGSEVASVVIPLKHAGAWINTLNQARLVLACQQGFGEEELARPVEMPLVTTRDVARFQMDFYALLQETLLETAGL